MNDPISEMTELQVVQTCKEICGVQPSTYHKDLIGYMILRLQEWDISFTWDRATWRTWVNGLIVDQCLQVAFLRTALALGKWSPKVEEEHYYRLKADHSIVLPKHLATNGNLWERVRVTPWEE